MSLLPSLLCVCVRVRMHVRHPISTLSSLPSPPTCFLECYTFVQQCVRQVGDAEAVMTFALRGEQTVPLFPWQPRRVPEGLGLRPGHAVEQLFIGLLPLLLIQSLGAR